LAFRIALPCLLIRAGQHCALLCVFRGAPLASFAGLNVRRVSAQSARSKAPVRRHCAAARLIMRVADGAPRVAPQPSARRRRWTRRSRRARRRRSTPRRRRSTRRRRQARARCCFGSSIARPASKLSGFWEAATGQRAAARLRTACAPGPHGCPVEGAGLRPTLVLPRPTLGMCRTASSFTLVLIAPV